ncbi:hypothetical protein F0562_005185 [Nyssa sinensis]|uniref:Serpin domain-containing protein n=1 Tax=Nyssa sinensis TaxID=561372 RepID=A0A5J5ALF8_9ASTE|nr:hypothetical protein F0562_005185 [Nyssa sinensis]
MEYQAQTQTSDFNSHFCIQMVNQVLLRAADRGSNFVLSPLSFHVLLILLAVGSTGKTLEQLLFHLGSKNIDDLNFLSSQIVALITTTGPSEGKSLLAGPLLSFVNGAWVDQRFSLKPSFKGFVEGVYKAEAREVDFLNKADKVRDEINSWSESATKGLIKELLPSGSLDDDTTLVLANALYFKGTWSRKFDETMTRDRDFRLLGGQLVRVPFMTARQYEQQLYGSFDGYKILRIPYQNGQNASQFSMYFFLPHEVDGLQNLVHKFNSNPGFLNQQFTLWKENLPNFWIPRFKFSFQFEASESIKQLGLNEPLMDLGEITEMVDSPQGGRLCLSKIFHKSYIEVNEDGTEAAASSALRMKCSATYPTPSFVADHPFLFMIREETSRIVLFIGAVLNPLFNPRKKSTIFSTLQAARQKRSQDRPPFNQARPVVTPFTPPFHNSTVTEQKHIPSITIGFSCVTSLQDPLSHSRIKFTTVTEQNQNHCAVPPPCKIDPPFHQVRPAVAPFTPPFYNSTVTEQKHIPSITIGFICVTSLQDPLSHSRIKFTTVTEQNQNHCAVPPPCKIDPPFHQVRPAVAPFTPPFYNSTVTEQKHIPSITIGFSRITSLQDPLSKILFRGMGRGGAPAGMESINRVGVGGGVGGKTLEQLLFHLGSKNIDDLNFLSSQIVALITTTGPSEGKSLLAGPLLSFVNGAWVDQRFSLKPSFKGFVEGVYKAEAREVDFLNKADKVRDEINSWSESATRGLIKELLPSGSLDDNTTLVLANALYFKGTWSRKFDETMTRDRDFRLLGGQLVRVPFMTARKYEQQLYGSFDGYKILRIPYQNGQNASRFSMYFFLPHEVDGLQNLVHKFNSNPGFLNQQFTLWKENLPNFWIPRFKFSFQFEASESIKQLGLNEPFMDLGEITEMVDSPHGGRLCLSKIFHKSYIEVNEDGTEAAASSALRMKCSATYPTPSFVADHPFLFMIREETSRIVFFIGAVLNPLFNPRKKSTIFSTLQAARQKRSQDRPPFNQARPVVTPFTPPFHNSTVTEQKHIPSITIGFSCVTSLQDPLSHSRIKFTTVTEQNQNHCAVPPPCKIDPPFHQVRPAVAPFTPPFYNSTVTEQKHIPSITIGFICVTSLQDPLSHSRIKFTTVTEQNQNHCAVPPPCKIDPPFHQVRPAVAPFTPPFYNSTVTEQKHIPSITIGFSRITSLQDPLSKILFRGMGRGGAPAGMESINRVGVGGGVGGKTLEQLLFHLGSKNIDDLNFLSSQIVALITTTGPSEGKSLLAGPLLSFVNGAWVDQRFSLKPSFKGFVEGVYKAEAREVDFLNKADKVRDEINSWSESATRGLIKELLPSGSLDDNTTLVLANALYFKGTWSRKFDETMTRDRDFRLLGGQLVRVPFMTARKYEQQLYGSFDGYKILRIPYQNGQNASRFSMYFFLPHEVDGLQNLVHKFNSNPGFLNQQFTLWKENLPNFWIPRFKFSFQFEASESIKQLGLNEPFMDLGEITEMVDSPHGGRLCLSKIFHKSYIEVNEDGTEAAASSALRMKCSATYPTPSFVADHPFLFMIREETSRIVFFIGAVLNPLFVG